MNHHQPSIHHPFTIINQYQPVLTSINQYETSRNQPTIQTFQTTQCFRQVLPNPSVDSEKSGKDVELGENKVPVSTWGRGEGGFFGQNWQVL